MILAKKHSVILSEEELVTLIKESNRGQVLEVSFGGKLLLNSGNAWAFKRVEEMRGINLEEAGYERAG